MALFTLQIIEGLERGRILTGLSTPTMIGREDDNEVRLNDERVSRFHAKIQEDAGRVILTDLDSTNGTRVNGHPVQMRVLRPGDQLSIGRCLLVYGSRDEIERHMKATIRRRHTRDDRDDRTQAGSSGHDGRTLGSGGDDGAPVVLDDDSLELFPGDAPGLPDALKGVQRAELSDVLAFIHEQIRIAILSSAETDEADQADVRVDWASWQRLLKLEMDLSVWMRRLADPNA